MRIGTETFKFETPLAASGKGVPCQQIDFGGPEAGGFPFFSVFAILMQLFHRLLALQVGTVPFTRTTCKPWTSIFANFADPLWALRRTLTGHSNGVKSCTPGTNEHHVLLAARRLIIGPEFVVVRIGNRRLSLPNVPFIIGYKEPWGKRGLGGQSTVGRASWRCIVVTKESIAETEANSIKNKNWSRDNSNNRAATNVLGQ